MAQPALDAFGFIGIARFAFGIQLQGAVINGRAKSYAPAAAMAEPGLLDVFNQIRECLHLFSCSVARFARCALGPLK